MNLEDLFAKTTCKIGNEQKSGEVLAVTTYIPYRRIVCFQIKGEEIGRWVSEDELTGICSSVETTKNEVKTDISARKKAKNEPEAKQDIYLEKKGKNEVKLDTSAEEEAKKEAEQDIHALVKFVADTSNEIQNKATKDFEILVLSLEDTIKAIQDSTKVVVDALINYTQQMHEWLKQTIQGAAEVIDYIEKTLNELWSRYWRDRIIDAITGQRPHHFKAKAVVKKLKQDYPYETDRQIAERLILEKALFATITGSLPLLAAGIPLVGIVASKIIVKFLNITGLLVELIYQVGVSYGFDEFKEGDYVAIFTLAFRIEKLAVIGVDFLLKESIPDPIIPAVTNMIVFLSVGYAACEFYEAKAKGMKLPTATIEAFIALEKKVEAYLEEAIAEKTTIEATVVEAVCVKEQLALN